MTHAARPNDLLRTYYARVLGVAYQALGDAALAIEATEVCFKRLARRRIAGPVEVWRTLMRALQAYVDRGMDVALLDSNASGWQASLLDGLADLAPFDRVLLLLHYHEHLGFDQLALVMDQDVEAVRRSLAQVRGQLIDNVGLNDALR